MNIYVGNLPKTVDQDTIRKLFEEHGQVGEITLIRDKFTQELRGFGFVEMPSKDEAQKAINGISGSELEGRSLIVNEAKPRNDRNSRNRHGGGGGGGRRW